VLHSALLIRDTNRSTSSSQALDPASDSYGHGNNKSQSTQKSILHPDLKTIPRVPKVQLIGNGTLHDHEGLETAALKHPSHTTFHMTPVSPADEQTGITCFHRWHIDAALYELSPLRVTTLYAVQVPQGTLQTCRYDDGTGDTLPIPLGTTAFVSGRTMFVDLPPHVDARSCQTPYFLLHPFPGGRTHTMFYQSQKHEHMPTNPFPPAGSSC
jgi:hypothetical protein